MMCRTEFTHDIGEESLTAGTFGWGRVSMSGVSCLGGIYSYSVDTYYYSDSSSSRDRSISKSTSGRNDILGVSTTHSGSGPGTRSNRN